MIEPEFAFSVAPEPAVQLPDTPDCEWPLSIEREPVEPDKVVPE